VRLLKTIATLFIAAVGAFALYTLCWAPVVCSHVTRKTIASTNAALAAQSYRQAIYARNNLKIMQPCKSMCAPIPTDVAMIEAVNLRLLGRPKDAIAVYREALNWSQRPEIYVNLGHALVEAGDREGARAALLKAASFSPGMIDSIDDGELRRFVEETVHKRDVMLRQSRR
jgi:tetratricopeptide (TPR) repeat protein